MVFVVKFVFLICECVVDMFLEILFRLWIVDWKWFCKVFKLVCKLLIVEIVLFILLRIVEVFFVERILLVLILRFDGLKFEIFVVVSVGVDKLIEIVWFEFVFIRNEVENVFERIFILVNLVVVVICEIFVCSVDIFFWSVVWFVELLILFCDWIVRVWICWSVVVVLDNVFLVVCDNEIVLLVLWMVWFRFLICEVIWLVIWRFVVLLVVLLIWKFEDKCLNEVFNELFILKSWCWVFNEDILVLMNIDIKFFLYF